MNKQMLKHKNQLQILITAILSETALAEDWNSKEDEEAWKDL